MPDSIVAPVKARKSDATAIADLELRDQLLESHADAIDRAESHDLQAANWRAIARAHMAAAEASLAANQVLAFIHCRAEPGMCA